MVGPQKENSAEKTVIFRDFYYLRRMMFRSKSSLSLVFAAAVVLAGCIKMPKANGTEPGGPDDPDSPDFPPPRNTPAFSFSGTGFCGIFRILHPETINTFRQ